MVEGVPPPSPKDVSPEQPASPEIGKLEGHKVSKTPPKMEHKEKLSREILQDPQADRKKGLSQMQAEKGTFVGFFLFIYYALFGRKSPQQDIPTQARVESKQIHSMGLPADSLLEDIGNIEQEVADVERQFSSKATAQQPPELQKKKEEVKKASKPADSLEKKLDRLDPSKIIGFNDFFLDIRNEMQFTKDSGRLKQLQGMELQAAEKLVKSEFKQPSSIAELKTNDLFGHYRLAEAEQKRLDAMEFGEFGFGEDACKKVRDERVRDLNFFKEMVHNEYAARAEKELENVNNLISNEAREAARELPELQKEREGLEQTYEKASKHESEVRNELQRLELRKQQAPNELKIIESQRENLTTVEEKILEASNKRDKVIGDANTLKKYGEEWNQIQRGKRPPFSENEDREYRMLSRARTKIYDFIEEKEKEISELNKTKQDLIKELGDSPDNKIESLKLEIETLPDQIAQQEIKQTPAEKALAVAKNKLDEVDRAITKHEQTLEREAERIELKRALRKLARAIAFREGVRLTDWSPNDGSIPEETQKAIQKELDALPLPHIEVESIHDPADNQPGFKA